MVKYWKLCYLDERKDNNLVLASFIEVNSKKEIINAGSLYKVSFLTRRDPKGEETRQILLKTLSTTEYKRILPMLPENELEIKRLGRITKIDNGFIYQLNYAKTELIFAKNK